MQILEEKVTALTGYRLSPQQRQIWSRQPAAQCVISLTGELHDDVLRRAIASVVEQHEILRTSFQRQPGMRTPVQVIGEQPALGVSLARHAQQDHTLVLTLPALCADYKSLSLLTTAIARAYDECLSGELTPVESLQYADFCEWQNELAESADAGAGRAFWLGQPAVSHPMHLPFAAAGDVTSEPERLTFTFDPEITSELVRCADQHGLSTQALLLACWQMLLRRLSAQETFYVNCLFEGRHYDELNNAIGLFARSLPLFCRLHDERTIVSLGAEIEDRCSQMSEWQEYYEGEATPQTDQISFEYLERVDHHLSVSGLDWNVLDQRAAVQHARLGLRCERIGADEVRAEISYDPRAYTRADVERLIERMQTIVQSAVTNPAQTVSQVAIVSERERKYLVEELSHGEPAAIEDESIVTLFEKAAERYTNRVAVVCGEEQLTYGELNRRANQLARFLRVRGIGPDVNVGLFMERRVNAFVALLAVLKAGGAFVPLNLDQPQDRVAQQLADMQTPLVLTEEKLLGQLPEFGGTAVCLDRAVRWWEHESENDVPATGFPDHIAYVIYTSGSTGTPKGVAVTRRNLLNYTLYMCRRLRLDTPTSSEPLSFATVSTLAADLGHTAIFPSLVTGGCLHVIDYDVATDSEHFARYLAEHPIDVLKIVPSHLSALLSSRGVLPRKCLVLGGEALSHQLVDRLAQTSSTCRIINHYGPTEATVGCLTFDVDETTDYLATIPIGHPIANASAYVVDTHVRLVPLGATGELCIGGAGVARGYLNQAAQTAERFIPDSYSGQTGARLYRTGDLVRQLRNGAIEFLGRVDSQVKIRGHRIELGEIEVALRQHPEIREVVVVAASDEREHKRLVAYLVSSGKPAPTVSDLQSFLKTRLPAYMWPSIFVLLDEMPLTPNGKVDRRALPAPETALMAAETRSLEAPRSDVEKTLAQIWKQVLGIAEIGIHDNFFELGGDSIISIQIIARANQRGIRLMPKQLFQNQTIAQLAAVADTTGAPVEADQGIVTGPLPLTPVQRWFFEQNISEPHHWNQSLLLEVKQTLDSRLLEKAVKHLFTHHDALRLRFTKVDSDWQQFNAGVSARVPFEYVDLSTLTPAEQSSTIERRAAESQTRIDLSDGSLIRVVFFNCGANEPARLMLVIHHLAIDGISWRVLLADLQTAYDQLARGENVQLAPKTTSFKRWAHQLVEHAQTAETIDELPFWFDQIRLNGRLPRDKQDGENTVASSETFSTELNADETRTLLRDVPARFHTQINDALLAALARALTSWTNEASSLIELEGHGREELDEETDVSLTVGWFTTHFPVALNLEAATTPGRTLQIVKQQLRRIPRRGIGYGLLRYLCTDADVAAQLRAAVQPELSFNYLGQIDRALTGAAIFTFAKENAGPSRSPSAKRPFLLEVGGSVVGGRLLMNWTYSRNVHYRATIERLAEYFGDALRSLINCVAGENVDALTPADFPLARLNQTELDELTRSTPFLEDIYPLSSVQHGLLFHSLYAPNGGLYFEQKSCLLRGKLNSVAFRAACEEVVNRHPILRTSFRWENLDEPLQVVHHKIEVPWTDFDWRTLGPFEQQQRLEQFLKDDRARRFDPAVAPLMRMALIRIDDQTHRFIWSHHHLLLDGWTMPILFEEVYVCYDAFTQSRTPVLPEVRPYRDYVQWLKQQDLSEAEAYWREALRGLKPAASFSQKRRVAPAIHEADIYDQQELLLSADVSARVRAFVRQHQLTINTLVQGMWALLLSHHTRNTDVVFGATVSGRPPSLKGVERMVGLFINSLPVRVRVRSGETMLAWLKALQDQQVEMRQYEYTPLIKLQEWSDVAHDVPLFDHVLVFDNYPVNNSSAAVESPAPPEERFTFEEFEAFEKTNYVILIQAGMGEQLTFRILYDRQLLDIETIARIPRHFEMLIESAIDHPVATLKAMLDRLSAFDHEREAANRQARQAAKFKRFRQVQPKVITAEV
jgi:amino acid adenylation domain-containing protein/non-ribosomal peptide synthase protein (TIGR01720 family)